MDPQEFSRKIYCAIADTVTFDAVAGSVEIVGSVTEFGVRNLVLVVASGVTQLRWDGVVKEPDGFFELSTVELRWQEAGWFVAFEPWFTTNLNFTCRTLQLNGVSVEGSGAWYQDSFDGPLPAAD